MAKSLEQARQKLDDEYGQVRRTFDELHQALDRLEAGGPEDDLSKLREDLEDEVRKIRTGGLTGHGANGHARARKEYLDLKAGK